MPQQGLQHGDDSYAARQSPRHRFSLPPIIYRIEPLMALDSKGHWGAARDVLVRHGGTGILSETPEICRVEHTLRICSGERSKSEELRLGDHEFVPWCIGGVG